MSTFAMKAEGGHGAGRRFDSTSVGALMLALVLAGAVGCGGDEEIVEDSGTDTGSPDAGDTSDGSAVTDAGDGSTDVPVEEVPYDVIAPGPHRIGHTTIEHTYTAYPGDEPRTIKVHIWYPTADTSGVTSDYLGGIFVDEFAWQDAVPTAPPEGTQYPVIAYSHGDRGFGGTASFMMRHFASHGWIGVAPDHTGNLLTQNTQPRPTALYVHRSTDVSASVDVLETLPDGHPLQGMAATERVLMTGHSFGTHSVWGAVGATFDVERIEANCTDCDEALLAAFRAGVRDERMVAGIPMAGVLRPDWFGDTGFQSVTVPMLALSGTEDRVGAEEQFESTVGVTLTWLDITGGCHETFALGLCDTLDPVLGYEIVAAWALAFARVHVLNDDQPSVTSILDGSNWPWTETEYRLERR